MKTDSMVLPARVWLPMALAAVVGCVEGRQVRPEEPPGSAVAAPVAVGPVAPEAANPAAAEAAVAAPAVETPGPEAARSVPPKVAPAEPASVQAPRPRVPAPAQPDAEPVDGGEACGPGQRRRDGACVADCPPGTARCGPRCANLGSDPANCGACGVACHPGEYCAGGSCQFQSRRGSCPYLFLWEGDRYRFHTDLSGSPLAFGLDFFKPAYYGANVYELGDWSAHDGLFRMRLRELIWEASYFDQALLVVADVPQGYGIFNEWSLTSQLLRPASLRYQTVRAPRAPVRAVSASGADVRAAVSAADGVPMPVAPDGLSRVELDFGPIEHPGRARLVVTTWAVFEDFRATQRPPFSAGTTVETPDGKGGWRERLVAGKSASDARTWIIDLAGVLEPGQTRLRLTLAHQPSVIDVLDAVLLDDSEQVPFTLTAISPRVAELRDGGAAPVQAATLSRRMRVEDERLPPDPEALLAGSYTRFGDVRPLLADADDRFVLMAHGDELFLEFEAPPQPPGTTRRVFLQADVFYSLKFHPFGRLTETLEPLPFHGMKSYPYAPEEWPYRGDAAYARYRVEWNTRELSPPPAGR